MHRSPLTAVTVEALVVRQPAAESTVLISPQRNGSLAAGTNTAFGFITNGSAITPAIACV